ncbi:MAG: thioredoxin TrxA [Dongiaceae bacterium]
MSSTQISDSSFETDVLKSNKPVLVDFWAEWCGPCKMLAPHLEEIAQTMGDKVTVAKLNIDDNPRTTKNYGVKGIPTLMLFKNGQVAGTRIGNLPKSQLVAWVQSVL